MGECGRSLAGLAVEHRDRRADRVLERLWIAIRHQLCVDDAVFAARRNWSGNGGQRHHAFSREGFMKITDVRTMHLSTRQLER